MKAPHVALVALLCAVLASPSTPQGAPCSTLLSVVENTTSLTILEAAVTAAGFAPLLDDPDLVATVFAPTDEAFMDVFDLLNVTAEDVLGNLPLLQDVLMYHVVPGVAAMSTSLRDGQMLRTLLPNSTLIVDVGSSGVMIMDEMDRNSTVLAADVKACKAVAHVVDAVLLPAM